MFTSSSIRFTFSMYEVFPARAPDLNTTAYFALKDKYGTDFTPGLGRSAGKQAGYQIIAAVVTLFMAIVGGAVVGKLSDGCSFGNAL